MSGDKEATSEQSSSVLERVGYVEVYPSGYRLEEGLSQSSKREPSAHSPNDEEENYDGEEVEERKEGENEDKYEEGEGDREEKENEEDCEGKDDEDEDEGEGNERASVEGCSGSPRDGHTHPFILPTLWTVNDFKPMMTTNIFKNLRDHYQIPDNIPIRLPRKFEKYYSEKTADIGMYDAMCAAGLRLPLTALHHQMAIFLGLSVSQIAPNAQRIFIEAEIPQGRLSRGNRQLTQDEFFWCYRPQHISSSKGIYHFATSKKTLRLVFNMPDSNRNWKGRYFFVQWTDWVCHREKWATMPYGFDNTWGIVKDSGLVLSAFSLFLYLFV